jgi:hypothetical protein
MEIGFEVFTVVSTKMAVFWVARTSEMLVNFYQTTWHYNPEDSHLHYMEMISPNGNTFDMYYSALNCSFGFCPSYKL